MRSRCGITMGDQLEVVTDKTGVEVAHYANFGVARSRLLQIARVRMQGYYSKLEIFDVRLTVETLKQVPGLELACNDPWNPSTISSERPSGF